ncbi:MAG: hypothetical protein NTY77_16425 [Elusimicrobia bacterium]|nr:hypothetical protein [Elusimicrobiota bacterium]
MSAEALRPLCPYCSSDILRPDASCWLCGRLLPQEVVERLVVEDVLSHPVTLAGVEDLESSHFGLIFLMSCLAIGGFTVSSRFGWLFLVMLFPAGLWLVVESMPGLVRRLTGGASTSAVAWTVAALLVMPLSLILALASAGLAGPPGGALLRFLR